MSEMKYVWKSIRVQETDYDGCGNCIHAHDSEDACRVRGCVHAIGQIKDYYKRATKTHDKRTETHACVSPCDICRHYPPSSADGKPCSMCPAEPAEPTEQVRAYMSLADCVSRQAAINAVCSVCGDTECNIFDPDNKAKLYCPEPYAIMKLPSAETFSYGHENDWIPVSEKLPEDEGWYLVTDDSGGVRWLEVEHYDPESGLEPFCTVQNPVAWMALPSPYKAGDSNG